MAPETAEALDQFLVKLRACATGESSFTFIVDDPAGNSFIENPYEIISCLTVWRKVVLLKKRKISKLG